MKDMISRQEVFDVLRKQGMSEIYPTWKAIAAIGTETINDQAEIRRVFELDDAQRPDPDSGFALLGGL